MVLLLTISLILCIFFSGYLSSSETAFFSLSSMKVRAFRHGKDLKGKRVARLLSEPRQLLVTILMLNVLMNVLAQNVVSAIFSSLSSWWLSVWLPLALTLIFGEVIPKSIGYSKNTEIAYHTAGFLSVIRLSLIHI